MPHLPDRWRPAAAGLALALLAGGTAAYLKLRRDLRAALDRPDPSRAALQLVAVAPQGMPCQRWGGARVEGVAATGAALLTAGDFGIRDGSGDLGAALPTLGASCLGLWRGRPVAGLKAGGVFLRREEGWAELVSGFGALHPRALAETAGGELLVGAREGLFRAAWASGTLERLDPSPVRSIALGEGGLVLAGGEQGLLRVEAGRATRLATPDPWIEWVGCSGRDVAVVTPLGLARGPLGGALAPLSGGEEATSAAYAGERLLAASGGRLLAFGPGGRGLEEPIPSPCRKLFASSGLVFADTDAGLYLRDRGGWTLARPRPEGLPRGSVHLGALAWMGTRLVAGFFDGGLAVGDPKEQGYAWSLVPGSRAWGVNALLPAGGALEVASLRGVARFDGRTLSEPPEAASGPAFSLASTPQGVAAGFGQGVLLPGSRLLSAFHGLPGNQALALASGDALYVGTPTGLGAIRDGRVLWRVTAGEGKLPHPWITALAFHGDALFVGTYGGGVAQRAVPAAQPLSAGSYIPFPETGSLKVNTGCLVEASGRLYAGTEGRGLWRLSRDGSRFVHLAIQLPSPRVTAILESPGALLVGTDEGLARIPLPIPDEAS